MPLTKSYIISHSESFRLNDVVQEQSNIQARETCAQAKHRPVENLSIVVDLLWKTAGESGLRAEIGHNAMDTDVNATQVSAPQFRGLNNMNNATMNTSVRNRTTVTSSRRPPIIRESPLLRGGKEPMDAKILKITDPGVFLYLYSAFWDDRQTLPGEPVIRIITVTKTI